jgi:hypothetical protein
MGIGTPLKDDCLFVFRSGKTTPLQVVENAIEAIEQSEKPDVQLKSLVQFNKTDALQVHESSLFCSKQLYLKGPIG